MYLRDNRNSTIFYIIEGFSSQYSVTADNAFKQNRTLERVRPSIHISSPHQTSRYVSLKASQNALRPVISISGHYDVKRNGDYTIVNCGDHDGARLVSLLDGLWRVLKPSLRSVPVLGLSPAFRTFFGASTLSSHVKTVLTNVTTGVSLYPPQRRFQSNGSPLLICATADGQVVGKRDGVDYYYQCLLYPYKSLIAISGTPYIVICPYFFSSEIADSPPTDTCPTVDTSLNRFRGTGLDFTSFKVWALLEGILRYYIYATTGVSSSFAQDVNQCARLAVRQRLENPKNYVYYVASKFDLSL